MSAKSRVLIRGVANLFHFLQLCLLAGFAAGSAGPLRAQTASTGAIAGVVLDPSGSVVPGVVVRLTARQAPHQLLAVTNDKGAFAFPSLLPGDYQLEASKPEFAPLILPELRVSVTETCHVEVRLKVAAQTLHTEVLAEVLTDNDSAGLGKVVYQATISAMPLSTRNFSQLAGLTPGVLVGVYNAGELGIGSSALSQIARSNDGVYVHGSRSYDNNWQLDGISVSDVMSSGSASGGIPVPNPDALEEFKVQTALYDAGFGRGAGANISVVTRRGSSEYHGSLFEFLRNDLLNANDFFRNETGRQRPDLKQNQFGVGLGGPIQRDRLLFFTSYQGTRQTNGTAAGQARVACSAGLNEPPLTNDRSPAALGALFGGMTGALGGVPVSPDGSNINPVALALLNFKLPDGSFLIPTPQTVDMARPFASQGFSVFTAPCPFSENQLLVNVDYVFSRKNHLATRFFISDNDQNVTFPGNGRTTTGNVAGFSSPGESGFRVFSVADAYEVRPNVVNELHIGYARTRSSTSARAPFEWSDVGVLEGSMNENNELPSLTVVGSISMASAFPRTYTQNSFALADVVSWTYRTHALRFGTSLTRLQDNLNFAGFGSYLQFLSWPDFLLGLSASANGTGNFSNVFQSADSFGLLNREFRAWEGSAFAADSFRIKHSFTLNFGMRYERIGQFGDRLGRNSSFDASKADRAPGLAGSVDGYVVASNFTGILPAGVTRAYNTAGTYGNGQNRLAPRIGFAWQMPRTTRVTMRGGYGIYYSRPTGQAFTSSVLSAPFALARVSSGSANQSATFQAPFVQPFPTAASFPMFTPYSVLSNLGINALAADFQSARIQEYSLSAQVEVRPGWLLEVGYVGTEGAHLQEFRSLNQALSASEADPVNGVTTNTMANIPLRVPIPGIRPDALRVMNSDGRSSYNALEASLNKRLSHGVQFLASYTFSKVLDTDGSDVDGVSASNTLPLGNQNSPSQRRGPASIGRPHRFVFSATWVLPGPAAGLWRALLGAWDVSAVATIQAGRALTIAYTNPSNIFGISEDRAQLSGSCPKNGLVTSGSMESRLNNYFDVSCFTTPPVIASDGVGTAFGDSGTGIVNGPGQANWDMAISKSLAIPWPHEKTNMEIRAELFNAFNHPQFANPDANFSSPTFGVISSTSVNARIVQLALRLSF